MQASYDPTTKKLTLILDCNDTSPPLSSTGKSRTVASTQGNVKTPITILGKPLTIGVNAYIPTK